jgi:hypothetical protein
MLRVTLLALLAVLMGSLASYAVSGQASQAPTQKLDIVESIGCLAEEPKGTWVLTDATEPAVAKQPYTNEAAEGSRGEAARHAAFHADRHQHVQPLHAAQP